MSSQQLSLDGKETPALVAETAAGCNLDTLKAYGQAIQLAVSNFVMDYPLIAIVSTVVFGIFGLTMILPQFISTLIIYIPLLAFSYMAVSTLASEENRERFSHRLAESLFKSDVHDAAAQLALVGGGLQIA